LGDATAPHTWVYLGGLVRAFRDEKAHRAIIDGIAKQLNLRVIAVPPKVRCPQFDNMLYWPHDTDEEVLATYRSIKETIGNRKIDGFIGFSNGGYFLTHLAQTVELNAPVIAIGAGGIVKKDPVPNVAPITVIIGKKDEGNYAPAIRFVDAARKYELPITLIEHDGGHEIPAAILKSVLERIN